MMKFIFALLLCGFSTSLASPTCDESDAYKCSTGEEYDKYAKTEEELKKFCRIALPELDCTLRFCDRCPNTLTGVFHESTRMNRVLYGKICEKDNPLRTMFLAKSACLEENEDAVERSCSEEVAEQDYCKRIDPVQKCVTEELNKKCGSDATELYSEFDQIKRAMMNVFCITE